MRKRVTPNHHPAPYRNPLRPLNRRYPLSLPKNPRDMLRMPPPSDLIPDGPKIEHPSIPSPTRNRNRNRNHNHNHNHNRNHNRNLNHNHRNIQHNHNMLLTFLNSIRNPLLPPDLSPLSTPTAPRPHWWPAKAPTVSAPTRPHHPRRKVKRGLTLVVALLRSMPAYPPATTRIVIGLTDQLPITGRW